MVFSASITTSGTTRPLLSSTITTIHAAEMRFRPGTCWRIDLGSGPSFLSDTLSTCTCMVSSIQRRRSNYPSISTVSSHHSHTSICRSQLPHWIIYPCILKGRTISSTAGSSWVGCPALSTLSSAGPALSPRLPHGAAYFRSYCMVKGTREQPA